MPLWLNRTLCKWYRSCFSAFFFSEQRSFEVRADFFNPINRAGRGDPVTNITNPLFGKITGAQRGPRNIQIEARVTF